MREIIKYIRQLISLPFLIPGSIMFFIGEILSGEKFTWRYNQIEEIMKSKMVCSKCGHIG